MVRSLADRTFQLRLIPTTTTDDLYAYFSTYGEITDCIAMNGRGFGLVEFTEASMVDIIMETPLQHTILGKPVEIKRYVLRGH